MEMSIANSIPAKIPGLIMGSVTCQKIWSRFAPSTAAVSS